MAWNFQQILKLCLSTPSVRIWWSSQWGVHFFKGVSSCTLSVSLSLVWPIGKDISFFPKMDNPAERQERGNGYPILSIYAQLPSIGHMWSLINNIHAPEESNQSLNITRGKHITVPVRMQPITPKCKSVIKLTLTLPIF